MHRIATLEVSGNENPLHATEIGKIVLHGNSNAIVEHSGTAQIEDDGKDKRIPGQ
ncbi:DUF3060 domain-containing protein [Xanthomonas albilineans]|uniref:DUF3060 domain-containing protein n=1 Tax=Xanthomonas albilineans TaxID=29447 RepID=UPI0009B99CDD|nr:DUF3060 domain-containing protein [Xanthomonas albilineans]PPU94680.1 DUF3060 domain-containing protein [Xanthomonas albilineans]